MSEEQVVMSEEQGVMSEGKRIVDRQIAEERPHRRLVIWQRSVDLVVSVYKTLKAFPKSEQYNLISQIQRAVISIPSNIAEGCARRSSKEKMQFWIIARGSVSELDTQFEICRRLGYLDEKKFEELNGDLAEVSRMLSGLIRSRKRGIKNGE